MASDLDSAESTNWLAPAEQQFWFQRFAISIETSDGSSLTALRFQQFQSFLKSVIYNYLSKFQVAQTTSIKENQHENGREQVAQNQQANENRLDGNMDRLKLDDNPEGSSERFSKQQEMRLFRRFDLNNDHLIDWEEFAQLSQKWLHQVFAPNCGLVVVDVQNDFIDGSLALINGPAKQDGAEVIPVVNSLVEAFQSHKATVVYTLDWHPQDHVSFHANLHLRKHTLKRAHSELNDCAANGYEPVAQDQTNEREFKYKKLVPKANLFDTVLFDDGRVEQKLWPIHCIRNSWGAQLHPDLLVVPDSIRIQKGTLSNVDSYSAFWDNMRANETGLRQELANKRVSDLFFCGLATDYCVAASAMDAIKAGFVTFVVEDACRGIDVREIDRRRQELVDNGGFMVSSELALSYLRRDTAEEGGPSKHRLHRSLIKTITYRKAFC